MSEAVSDEILFATRKGGRSKGVLHAERDCFHIRDLPDEDIIDRPPWAFNPDQERCNDCFSSGGEVGR